MQPNPSPPEARYRYERKFVTESHRGLVESVVRFHPALFRPVFHRRWINNVYFDSWSLESYKENLAGSSRDRVKVRIRWYGDLWGRIEKPVLELKIKHNVVNRKESFELEPFTMTESPARDVFRGLFNTADVPQGLRHDLLKLHPTLVNRYSRNYFQTTDRAFRITIDSDLVFNAFRTVGRAIDSRWCSAHGIILELKYARDVSMRADAITQHLPFRLSRSSKYVDGIERTRSHLGIPIA